MAQAAAESYKVEITGVEEQALKNALENKSLLIKLADEAPQTPAALDRRIRKDVESFTEAMKEHGYFGAQVTANHRDQHITIAIESGSRYDIRAFELDWPGDGAPERLDISPVTIIEGQPALPDTILEAEKELLAIMLRSGYPRARISGRQIFVSHEDRTITIRLFPDPGPLARYGKTTVTGLKKVEEDFIRRRIQWQEGEIFNIEDVAKTRKNMTQSGVIAVTETEYGEIAPDGTMPVTLKLREGKHRSVGGGLAYSTTRGPVGNVFWEHRNLFGEAEKFRVKTEAGTETYALGATLHKPDMFGNKRLGWQNAVEFRRESLEAYDKDTASASTALNYQYSDHAAVSAGVTVERSRITEEGGEDENYSLLSFPLTWRYDNTDDFLNPRDGFRINTSLTPFQVINGQDSFVRTDTGASHYWELGEDFVWANRVRAAAIFGQNLEDIPADKRLYAGGGGSVRGFGYQMLGPLDENFNPTGGRAAYEIGTEGRYMFTETIEGVAFAEGGQVSENLERDTGTDFLWSAGLGGRYYTAVGPVRLDIALPVNKREVDDPYQFYISIGQAF